MCDAPPIRDYGSATNCPPVPAHLTPPPFPCTPPQDNTVTDADYMQALSHVLLPIALEFQPDLVILSAGFDAAQGDPLGGWWGMAHRGGVVVELGLGCGMGDVG